MLEREKSRKGDHLSWPKNVEKGGSNGGRERGSLLVHKKIIGQGVGYSEEGEDGYSP